MIAPKRLCFGTSHSCPVANDDTPGGPVEPATARNVHVRPLGYASPRPVVRRLGDRELYLGNGRAADSGAENPAADSGARNRAADRDAEERTTDRDAVAREFAAVLTLTAEERALTTHHRPLVDGPGNEWAAFGAAVDCARRLHRDDGALLIHCEAGISRSAAIAATTIAAEERRPFRDGLEVVQTARPHAIPHPALHELAVCYLAARG